jgi:hypothetical protein
MSVPCFSVILPTKGRSFLVPKAVHSLLGQSLGDWELVVVDNDDSDATRQAMDAFRDPRVRYVRTGGLSMTDNWERGAQEARGRFLCVIEDKQMLKPHALARILEVAERTQGASIRWSSDSFDDESQPPRVRRASADGQVILRPSRDLVAAFTRNIMGYKKILPLPQVAAIRRDLVEQIRRSPVGRLFPEVSPDVAAGFLQLAHVDSVVEIHEALVLYTSSYHSNGRASHRKEASSRDFFRRLSGGEAMCYDRVPIKVLCTPSGIFNDFLRFRALLKGTLAECELHWPSYFIECRRAMDSVARSGVDMTVELAEWARALGEQPAGVRDEVAAWVRAQKPPRGSTLGRMAKSIGDRLGMPLLERRAKRWIRGKLRGDPEWRFSTPEEYLRWEAANPRQTP